MKRKRMLSALLVVAMAATMFAGCGNKGGSNSSTQGGKAANDGDIKEFTAFFAVPGSEINDDNEVQQIIAEKTGVKVKETWLTGQTAEEAIGTLVAGDEYPDFICGGNGMPQLYDANPTMEDGTENIPYTILGEDWRYFCLENAPQFLDGYPNDGSCMVDPDTLKVMDYNTSDTAVKYFKKLNEEYQKGIVDPESFTQTYDEYIAKLSSGRVLGMIDQWWDFAFSAGDAIKSAGLDAQGCDYIPVPVTIDGRKNQWHNSGGVLNSGDGLAITKDCDDVEAALQFVDDLLSEEIHNLRFWGVEGEDYQVGDDGLFYRTKEQRAKAAETDYKASHACSYSYFPQYDGTCDDGLNATKPSGQAKEFFDGLNEDVKKAFQAYGVETYVEMLGTNEAPGPWYPMWSFSNNFTTDTEGGMAWTKIGEVKHEQLPQVVMAKDFDSAWKTYMDAYNACNPDAFLSELQAELDKRMKDAAKYE